MLMPFLQLVCCLIRDQFGCVLELVVTSARLTLMKQKKATCGPESADSLSERFHYHQAQIRRNSSSSMINTVNVASLMKSRLLHSY